MHERVEGAVRGVVFIVVIEYGTYLIINNALIFALTCNITTGGTVAFFLARLIFQPSDLVGQMQAKRQLPHLENQSEALKRLFADGGA